MANRLFQHHTALRSNEISLAEILTYGPKQIGIRGEVKYPHRRSVQCLICRSNTCPRGRRSTVVEEITQNTIIVSLGTIQCDIMQAPNKDSPRLLSKRRADRIPAALFNSLGKNFVSYR